MREPGSFQRRNEMFIDEGGIYYYLKREIQVTFMSWIMLH